MLPLLSLGHFSLKKNKICEDEHFFAKREYNEEENHVFYFREKEEVLARVSFFLNLFFLPRGKEREIRERGQPPFRKKVVRYQTQCFEDDEKRCSRCANSFLRALRRQRRRPRKRPLKQNRKIVKSNRVLRSR